MAANGWKEDDIDGCITEIAERGEADKIGIELDGVGPHFLIDGTRVEGAASLWCVRKDGGLAGVLLLGLFAPNRGY